MKDYEGYVSLICAVTHAGREKIRELTEEDIREIDSLLKELDRGGVRSKCSYKEVIDLRFGLSGEKRCTFREISRRLGVSSETARMKVKKGLRLLQTSSRIRKLKKFLSYIPKEEKITLSSRIEELELTTRTYNILKRLGIETVGELVLKYSPEKLLRVPGFGEKSLKELQTVLAKHNINFKDEFFKTS